ncbi:Protein of unknown function [Pyronema omphalodes CBS 100304]|uniref:Uncharacterized protein n=1 Tax=Pyronema omphalodes (strain CBS 100304) TaxID=1076935 RepID=U4LU15_PYROM|nr:Protein of unknown function [Pyronema omphalodes CBS 100304]
MDTQPYGGCDHTKIPRYQGSEAARQRTEPRFLVLGSVLGSWTRTERLRFTLTAQIYQI